MKIIQALREFEITASGSMAIYFIMCTLYVTILGFYGVLQMIKRML